MPNTILVIQFITQLFILLFRCKLLTSIFTYIILHMNRIFLFTEGLNLSIFNKIHRSSGKRTTHTVDNLLIHNHLLFI